MTLDVLGEPLKRFKGERPPCMVCPKVSEEAGRRAMLEGRRPTWEDADQALSEVNERVVEHYRRCKAVQWQTPDSRDPLVQRNAAVISETEDAYRRRDKVDLLSQYLTMRLAGGPADA